MTEGMLIEIMHLTIQTIALLTAPVIITIMIVGIGSQVLQTVTQLKDQAMSFVPKVFIAGIVFTLAIPWYIQLIQKYTEIIFSLLGRAAS
jgi:flagellar biosynthetic protein FliQ